MSSARRKDEKEKQTKSPMQYSNNSEINPPKKPCQAPEDESTTNIKDPKTENEGFEFQGILFEELPNEMIRCGICKTANSRLVSHLNNNERCNRNLSMPEFRKEYSKYRHRKRTKKFDNANYGTQVKTSKHQVYELFK